MALYWLAVEADGTQEMAERRSRANSADRRLISERTRKSLRLQATRAQVFRDHSAASGLRRLDTQDSIIDIYRSDDDEGDGSETTQVYELGGVPEGVRLGHNLYEAYEPTVDMGQDLIQESSSSSAAVLPLERVTSPRPLSPPLRSHRGLGANITRQNSIRRPPRTRVIDFNEFTTRLRHAHRYNNEQAASSEMLRSEDSADGTWRFSSTDRSRLAGTPVYLGPRRFLPLAAWADPHSRGDSDASRMSSDAGMTTLEDPASSQMPSSSAHGHYSTAGDLAPTSAGRSIVPPRLRRGGLRAPESLLNVATTGAGPSSRGEAPAIPDVSTFDVDTIPYDSLLHRRGRLGPESFEHEDGVHQLLTPRSITPADEN